MVSNRIVKSCLLMAFAFSQLAMGATWKTVGQPRVFSNMNGVIVTVVDLNPVGKTKRAIVEVSGSRSDADRAPQLTEIRSEGNRIDFIRSVGGKDFYTLTMSRTGAYWNDVTLPIPGSRTPASLSFNDKRSKESDGNAILNKLLLRRSSAIPDQKARRAGDEKMLSQASSEAEEACGTKFKSTIDWPSFTGESETALDVGAACTQALEAILSHCAEDEGKAAFKKFSEISCTVAKTVGVKTSGKKIVFSTAVESPGQYEMIYNWFDNNL